MNSLDTGELALAHAPAVREEERKEALQMAPSTSAEVAKLHEFLADARDPEERAIAWAPKYPNATALLLERCIACWDPDSPRADRWLQTWSAYILTGIDTSWHCVDSQDGLHWISDGSCDSCGMKNLG
ncbi:hypothetical protein [Gordonia sihwensis]|uniref:hypothetical protein n=1 Tax=Gordonia sihwensis TaxID=173559 RepID=UPI003D9954FC